MDGFHWGFSYILAEMIIKSFCFPFFILAIAENVHLNSVEFCTALVSKLTK